MNSFVMELSPEKNEVLDNEKMFSREIYDSLLKMTGENSGDGLKVSNFFGMFFEKAIILEKNRKYKVRVVTKNSEIFSKLTRKLFETAISKEKISFGEKKFSLSGIKTSDKVWCGEYDFEKEMGKIGQEDTGFYRKLELKIVTPVIKNEKSVYKFENILKLMLEDMEKEKLMKNSEKTFESIMNSVIVSYEKYREKRVNLLENKIQKIILGDIILDLRGYYGKYLNNILNYVKYSGAGEYREIGFGEIIVRESNSEK